MWYFNRLTQCDTDHCFGFFYVNTINLIVSFKVFKVYWYCVLEYYAGEWTTVW